MVNDKYASYSFEFLDDVLTVKLSKVQLGLAVKISSGKTNDMESDKSLIEAEDNIFSYSSPIWRQVCEDIYTRRPELLKKNQAKKHLELLIPETEPPVIRISSKEDRRAFFNLGELIRHRVLKKSIEYPLKSYQKQGAAWLEKHTAAILADDMGLGKTIQAIASLEKSLREGKIKNALILCPKSLIGNWEAEIQLWAKRLCIVVLHSSISTKAWNILPTQCHITITNYESLRGCRPNPGAFDLVIYDEIHKLKNPKSLIHISAASLKPNISWGLSGTPLENSPRDLISILHLLAPKKISFRDKNLPSASLRSLASEYIIRRNKEVISNELTQVFDVVEDVSLTIEQKSSYKTAINQKHTINIGGWITKFNKLRDICDFDPETKSSSKIDRALDIISSIRQLDQKAVVFSYRIEPLEILQEKLNKKYGKDAVKIITGQTSSISRSQIVKAYQEKLSPFILLCSMRATAEGLTLTAANHVIFLNEWWNPALNSQARDRVNRIGQSRDVYVHRIRTIGTVEDRLEHILKKKSVLFKKIVTRLDNPDKYRDDEIPNDFNAVLNTANDSVSI